MTIDPHVKLSRRAFAIAAASAAAGLTIGFRLASAQTPQGPQAGPPVPPMIKDNPQLDAWVRVAPDGTVTVMTGRVELGQGILTAMRQVAADELDVAPERLKLISGDTAQTPDEGITAGSMAVKFGSTALALACADARATLIDVAAKAWGVEPQAIKVQDAVMSGPGGQRMGYGEAAGKISLSRPVDVTAKRKNPARITGSLARPVHASTSPPRCSASRYSSTTCGRMACCSEPWRGRQPMPRDFGLRTWPPFAPCRAWWRWCAMARSWASWPDARSRRKPPPTGSPSRPNGTWVHPCSGARASLSIWSQPTPKRPSFMTSRPLRHHPC
jgi:hypothetical protein